VNPAALMYFTAGSLGKKVSAKYFTAKGAQNSRMMTR
jgi:hypothetical protein